MNVRVICTDVRLIPASEAGPESYRAEFKSLDGVTLPVTWLYAATMNQFEPGETYLLKIEEL